MRGKRDVLGCHAQRCASRGVVAQRRCASSLLIRRGSNSHAKREATTKRGSKPERWRRVDAERGFNSVGDVKLRLGARMRPKNVGTQPRAIRTDGAVHRRAALRRTSPRLSFCPLPLRTISSRRAKSTSLTRSEQHSRRRKPAPYKSDAINQGVRYQVAEDQRRRPARSDG